MATAKTPTVRSLSAKELDQLRPLWIGLHRHHKEVSDFRDLVEDDELSWERRRELYRGWLEEGTALVLSVELEDVPVGYATVHFVPGPDDTFAVGERYAELYSLFVAPEQRDAGIGSMLMAEIDDRLAAAGVHDLAVSVMAGNDDALRFYLRRGLRPAEVVLWRIGGPSRG